MEPIIIGSRVPVPRIVRCCEWVQTSYTQALRRIGNKVPTKASPTPIVVEGGPSWNGHLANVSTFKILVPGPRTGQSGRANSGVVNTGLAGPLEHAKIRRPGVRRDLPTITTSVTKESLSEPSGITPPVIHHCNGIGRGTHGRGVKRWDTRDRPINSGSLSRRRYSRMDYGDGAKPLGEIVNIIHSLTKVPNRHGSYAQGPRGSFFLQTLVHHLEQVNIVQGGEPKFEPLSSPN